MKLDPGSIDLGIEELEALVDGARYQRLNAGDHRKLRGAVETLGEMARLLANKDATLRQLRQMLPARGGPAAADPNVRCAVAERAEVAAGW